MTTQAVRLKIVSPALKLRVAPRLTRDVEAGPGLNVEIDGNSFVASLDLLDFHQITTFDPSAELVPVVTAQGIYNLVSVADLTNNFASAVQVVVGAGDVNVDPKTRLLIMNRAVDQSPSNIILPLANTKINKVKIVDFKGNSDAFPHTVKVSGADKFQGGLTQWLINGQGASITCDPIATDDNTSIGYAV